jgi:hypothetical protein
MLTVFAPDGNAVAGDFVVGAVVSVMVRFVGRAAPVTEKSAFIVALSCDADTVKV